ncbi:hypothetical protein NQ315_017209, partial [Exocentrus adspersus]
DSECGRVHLTVSSLEDTYLELNWVTNCGSLGDAIPDHILLSSKNIRDRNEDPSILVQVNFTDYPGGYYRTKVKFGEPWLPGNWEYSDNMTAADVGPHCFPYWISSIKGNQILDSRCLAIQPTWMSDNSKSIGNHRIGSMLIPGTHNSGSFKGVPSFIQNYVLNQDRSVWTQLVFGIRYLDFRIGYYGHDGFFINHDLVRITKIDPILKEIRKFVELAPKEIVVVDFHRFPFPSNFSYSLHKKFTDLLYAELGSYALPTKDLQVGKGPSLNEIWAKNKNLIICYPDKATIRANHWLWNPMQQFWGNTKKVSELQKFLAKSIIDHRLTINPMWALMAELTPQPIDIIFRTNNLRKLADDINKYVTKWIRDEWGKQVNVVATDYFLGNDIVNVAININSGSGVS